ncbi:MAG: hypothetical protein RIS70_1233 [Planctomycetota bacterium]|jgi:hypothetical protein
MKINEIEIGGRYLAKVSGRSVVVRVTDIREAPTSTWSRRRVCRKRIVAINESTGREITVRSAQRLRPLPRSIHIGSLAEVNDLRDAERASPEPGVAYDLRLIDGKPLGLTVRFVCRRGDGLVAHASDGNDYPVTGTGAYILCPTAKRKEAVR